MITVSSLGKWNVVETNNWCPFEENPLDVRLRICVARCVYELNGSDLTWTEGSFQILKLPTQANDGNRTDEGLRETVSILARTAGRSTKSAGRMVDLVLSSTLTVCNNSQFDMLLFPGNAMDGNAKEDPEANVATEKDEKTAFFLSRPSMSDWPRELYLPPSAAEMLLIGEYRKATCEPIPRPKTTEKKKTRKQKQRLNFPDRGIVDVKPLFKDRIKDPHEQQPLVGVHFLHVNKESRSVVPVPLYWLLFKKRLIMAQIKQSDERFDNMSCWSCIVTSIFPAVGAECFYLKYLGG